MNRETITFRLDLDKRKELDAIAMSLDRDRSYILNEAINAFLEVHRWQIDHIKEGLRQADAREFASEAEVKASLTKWRK